MGYSTQHLFVDDIEIGQTWESAARTITQTDIVNFAGLSGDFNPIHVDHEFSAQTPFGEPMAHGLLVLSIASGLGNHAPPMRTLAFLRMNEWHLRRPVRIGDTICMRSSIADVEMRSRNRRGVVTWQREIVNQNGKIVQEGQTVTLVEGRANLEKKRNAGDCQTPGDEIKSSSSAVNGEQHAESN